MSKTTALLVDVSNIYYCISKKWPGEKLDYDKFLNYIEEEFGDLRRAIAYGYQMSDEAQSFITCLKTIGFDVVYQKLKPKFKASDEESSRTEYKKPDQNVGIAMDAVRISDKVDTIVIGSSDPDLVPLVQWIKDQGLRCIIVAVGISKELKDSCNRYIEIPRSLLEENKVETVSEQSE